MFLEALAETGRDMDLEGKKDIVWDVIPDTLREDSEAAGEPRPIYGAEDVDDDRWTLLHWALYNGSSKAKSIVFPKARARAWPISLHPQ